MRLLDNRKIVIFSVCTILPLLLFVNRWERAAISILYRYPIITIIMVIIMIISLIIKRKNAKLAYIYSFHVIYLLLMYRIFFEMKFSLISYNRGWDHPLQYIYLIISIIFYISTIYQFSKIKVLLK